MDLQEINSKFAFLFEIPTSFQPLLFHENVISKTIIPSKADAFQLSATVNEYLTSPILSSLEQEGEGLLIRAPINDIMLSQIEQDYTLGCLVFSQIINAMLYEAYKYKKNDFDNFKTLTFFIPGNSKKFIRDFQEPDTYEIRLFIKF